MCVFSIPVRFSSCRLYRRSPPLGCNLSNLVYNPCTHAYNPCGIPGLWQRLELPICSQERWVNLSLCCPSVPWLFGPDETWITPENTVTPAALASSDNVFSQSPRAFGRRGGGTGLLISPKWRYSLSCLSSVHLLIWIQCCHVTCPLKLNIVVIYRPPGALRKFSLRFPQWAWHLDKLISWRWLTALSTSTFWCLSSINFFPALSLPSLPLLTSPFPSLLTITRQAIC